MIPRELCFDTQKEAFEHWDMLRGMADAGSYDKEKEVKDSLKDSTQWLLSLREWFQDKSVSVVSTKQFSKCF